MPEVNSQVLPIVGLTFTSIEVNESKDEIKFTQDNGDVWLMHHHQDCCEGVSIEDINGDLMSLVLSPILVAEERTSTDPEPGQEVGEYEDSFTWTFYRISTVHGTVVIRWYGSSNGYYSEGVDLHKQNSETSYRCY